MVGEKMARKALSLEELNKAYTRKIQEARLEPSVSVGKPPRARTSAAKASVTKANVTKASVTKANATKTRAIANRERKKAELEVTKRVAIVGAVIFVLIVAIFIIYRREPVMDDIVPVVLTEAEQEKWDSIEVQEGKLYIELNGRIEVDGAKANIRLVNPIYSAYTIGIQLWEKQNEDNLLYESEKLMPGTVLETIRLSTPLNYDEYECIVNYIIYDDEGNEKTVYPVEVKLIQKKI